MGINFPIKDFLYVLVSLCVSQSFDIGVDKFIDQYELVRPSDHSIYVHLLKVDAVVLYPFLRRKILIPLRSKAPNDNRHLDVPRCNINVSAYPKICSMILYKYIIIKIKLGVVRNSLV
jgi:hypothetical protein